MTEELTQVERNALKWVILVEHIDAGFDRPEQIAQVIETLRNNEQAR